MKSELLVTLHLGNSMVLTGDEERLRWDEKEGKKGDRFLIREAKENEKYTSPWAKEAGESCLMVRQETEWEKEVRIKKCYCFQNLTIGWIKKDIL